MSSEALTPIPWFTPKTANSELENLKNVISSAYYNEGELVTELEERLSKFFNVKNVIMTTSGTTALFLALKSLGVGPGDEVIVPNMTFIATANAVSLCGAKVVLAEVNENLMMDPVDVKKKINPLTAAIIPVHVSGRSANIAAIREVAGSLPVVEDAAEAFGSRNPISGMHLGTESDLGIFSLSPNKIITSGQGGVLITNNNRLAELARALKDQGRSKRGTGGDDLHPTVGFNFKYTNLQAAIALAQLDEINDRLNHLQHVYKSYTVAMQDVRSHSLIFSDIEKGEIPLWPELVCENRERMQDHLNMHSIGYRNIWLPISEQQSYEVEEKYLVSRRMSDKILWAPSSLTLSKAQIAYVSEKLGTNL